MKRFLTLCLVCALIFSLNIRTSSATVYPLSVELRVNQVGYQNSQTKIAYAITNSKLSGKFNIKQNDKVVYTGSVGKDLGALNSGYAHVYLLDFSSFDTTGTNYIVTINSEKSPSFAINNSPYKSVFNSMIDWFEYQKCGVATSKHPVCHANDGVKGGWHDAGDYIKFTMTTAWTSFAMTYAYLQNPTAFDNYGKKNYQNQVKVGLDFVNNMWSNADQRLYYQVANVEDHIDWRLPENDKNKLRGAYACAKGEGGDVAGNSAAALALGYEMYKQDNPTLANQYLTSAKQIYEWGKNRTTPHKDTADSPSEFYTESSKEQLYGDLALGAIELYRATGKASYLNDAKDYVSKTEGGLGMAAGWKPVIMYEIAKLDSSYKSTAVTYLKDIVEGFYNAVNSTKFKTSESVASWTHIGQGLLTDAIITQLYKELSNDSSYDIVITSQIDYTFGCNPWGYSFIQGAGSKNPKELHHNTSVINNDPLIGCVNQGPCDLATLQQQDFWKKIGPFDTKEYAYQDSSENYCCDEPTIYSNGFAIWMFSFFED